MVMVAEVLLASPAGDLLLSDTAAKKGNGISAKWRAVGDLCGAGETNADAAAALSSTADAAATAQESRILAEVEVAKNDKIARCRGGAARAARAAAAAAQMAPSCIMMTTKNISSIGSIGRPASAAYTLHA